MTVLSPATADKSRLPNNESLITIPGHCLQIGSLLLDTRTRTIRRDDKQNKLTPREVLLLTYLKEHLGQARTAEQILVEAWGLPSTASLTIVTKTVARLREKIDPVFGTSIIETVRNSGYQLNADDRRQCAGKGTG